MSNTHDGAEPEPGSAPDEHTETDATFNAETDQELRDSTDKDGGPGASENADTPNGNADLDWDELIEDTPDAKTDPVDDDATEDTVTLADAIAQRDEYEDLWNRARADYVNLNKRRNREVDEARNRGAAILAGELLDVLDNFGFALQAAAGSSDEQLAKGVELVHGQLIAALSSAGLETVPGVGSAFDPEVHEAVEMTPGEEARDVPEVAEVLRVGYRFKDQLLRPATVRVVE